MAVKKGLGRGLDILLPEMEEAPKSTMEIALGDIDQMASGDSATVLN